MSDEAKDLVSKMLCYDPSARITAQEILNHPWITMVSEESEEISEISVQSTDSANISPTSTNNDSINGNTTILSPPPNITDSTLLSSATTTLPTEFVSNESQQTLPAPAPVVKHDVSIVPPLPIIRPTMTRRQSASSTQLNGALRKLTGHVQERKLEKMATTITRFMSTMQLDKKQNTNQTSIAKFPIVSALRSRLNQRLGRTQNGPVTPGGSEEINEEELSAVTESMTNMISTEVRDLILNIFFGIGQGQGQGQGQTGNNVEVGKLTVEQFAQILSDILEVSGAPIMMISRFIDGDNDGFITAEDIFLAETKMIHKSPEFLKIFFSFYTDVLWYPGRNINHMNLGLPTNTIGNNFAKGTTVLKNMLTGDVPSQMFEAPKFITGF